MKVLEHITLKQLNNLPLRGETLLTVSIEETEKVKSLAVKAMKKLRGSGNGKLFKALLKDRKTERQNG